MSDIWIDTKLFGLWFPLDGYWKKFGHWTEWGFLIYVRILCFGLQIQFSPLIVNGAYNLDIHFGYMPKLIKEVEDDKK